jgi:TonB family protein
MRVRGVILAIVCSGVLLASDPLARAQDATSANLPDRVEPGEAATPKSAPKKKKPERNRPVAVHTSSQTPAPDAEVILPAKEPGIARVPERKKAHVKKRVASALQSEPASFLTATQLSLSSAQAMAMTAPLPEYPYEAKHANITGSGVCTMIIDTASGKVSNAMMAQSTGNAILDKVTIETFRRWRFKPGTVSQVRVPITYE